jgi:methylenetetrahydrofolate dehydrogenase (NADP+)/methenyltetrahydrofolate cyclohydrolase
MKDIVHEPRTTGVIIQLPLPNHIDTQAILNTVVPEKDVDVLSARAVGDFQVGKAKVVPPVAGAVEELLRKNKIDPKGKKTIVIGYGRLVGQPLATWFLAAGALVTIIKTLEQFESSLLKDADIVVSGVGKPHLVAGEYIKNGAVVIDVGTSEVNGEMVGDVDFESASKIASFITPAQGGVGPLTVAMVFKNLLTLSLQR